MPSNHPAYAGLKRQLAIRTKQRDDLVEACRTIRTLTESSVSNLNIFNIADKAIAAAEEGEG